MGNVRIWGRENDVAFLAWLDLSLERDFPFVSTAQPILKKYTGVSYSEDQIASRLGTIVREGRNKGYEIESSELRNEGSSSLHHLGSEMQKEVRVLLEKFREEEVPKKTKRKHVERPIVTLPDPDDSDSEPEINPPFFNTKQEISSRPNPSMISVEIPVKVAVDRTPKPRAENETTLNSSTTPATTSTKDSVSLQDMRRMHKEVVSRLKAETAAVRVQWQQAVEDHIHESKRRRQMAADLQAENTHLKTAQLERQKAGKDPLEEVLFRKDQEIWLLKQANHKMRTLATFAGRVEPPRKSLEDNEVGDAIDGMEQELQAILHGHDSSAPLLQPEFGVETDLASLLRAIYREDSAEDESSGHLLKRTVKWGSINVVRSLAVAALNEWVFATDFPDFSSSRNSRLLKAYRDTIFTHDGWTSLHNLELAAYNSLIDSSEFRKITVPRRADELASRLSKALAPLFPRSTDVESNANFEGWNEEQDVCEDRRYRMKGLFEAALRLKAATIMTDERYEFVVHAPGSSITESGTRTAPDLESQDESGYWLQASIYTYCGEPGDPADPLVDALVQSDNFISNRNNKEERKHCLAEKHLAISKMGDASMDVLGDSGQDMVDVDLVDRWAYTDDERLSPDKTTDRKRPLKLHAQRPSNKKRKIHHGSERIPEAGDSDYGEQNSFTPRKYKQNEGSGTKVQACPRCGGTYDNHGSLLNHIRNQTCVLCIPCDQWFKNSNLFKAHLKEEHSDAFGNVKYDFGNNDGSVDPHGSGDYDRSGMNGSDEDGSNMRTSRNARKPRRSFAMSDDSAEGEASDQENPACEYCEKTFTIWNLRRHLKNMSCKEHRDAKPDLARKILKKREKRDAEFAELSESEKPTCEYCGKTFTTGNLGRHLKNMNCKEHRIAEPELAKLRKKRDNTEFAEPSDSDEKDKQDDSARSTCQYCSRSYSSHSSLIRHLKNMSCKEYRDARPDLFRILSKQDDDQDNAELSELSDSARYACKFCGRPFMHEVGLRRHLAEMTCKEHQDADPDLAKELGKVRKSTGYSKPSSSKPPSAKSSSSKKTPTCEYCGSSFVDAWGRRRHLINMSCTEHHKAKPDLSKELREKRRNTEMSDGRRMCATCGRIFSGTNYSQHLRRRKCSKKPNAFHADHIPTMKVATEMRVPSVIKSL
ncbi:hypothetical protein VTL71DRAFT_16507 [Oculimacula yallundae]|uniref:C2H2-type domain-containing protein n=1 Tax=Oculimacula yallundae TaxID=86028 RepID=A0ABR4CEN2_9HELO